MHWHRIIPDLPCSLEGTSGMNLREPDVIGPRPDSAPSRREGLRDLAPLLAGRSPGDFVFLSGMASADEDGQIVPDTFENKAHRTYKNIARVLAAAGLDFSRVVQVRCYLAKQEDWDEHNRIYREYFSGPLSGPHDPDRLPGRHREI